MEALLRIENLAAAYGTIRAVRGISLTVTAGTTVTLLGANGAGKTTVLNTLSGLLKPEQGSMVFAGRELGGLRPDQITSLGLIQVPEGRGMLAPLTVAENLKLGAYIRRDREAQERDLQKIYAWFPRLMERRNQLAGSLSGGEQQMLAIGRALMGRPRLLMLDEPSMGLAPLLVNEVFRIIRAIKEEGVTILLVEQNAKQAFKIADYVYILSQGKIITEGDAASLQTDSRIIDAYLGLH